MIDLIGAGMPRTGTLTQKVALEMLGFKPCFHWVDVLADLDNQVPAWDQALDGTRSPAEIVGDARASTDWPGGYFYRELLAANPNAKVLLSTRDPDRWEPSFRETIVDMCYGETLVGLLARARARVDPIYDGYLKLVERMFFSPEHGSFPHGSDPDSLKQGLLDHNEAVTANVPAGQLLVWSVSDGWEPLCEFLEVPVPAEPLPHVNDRATFLDRVVAGAIAKLNAWQEQQVPA